LPDSGFDASAWLFHRLLSRAALLLRSALKLHAALKLRSALSPVFQLFPALPEHLCLKPYHRY
jgi:hypothetical protein